MILVFIICLLCSFDYLSPALDPCEEAKPLIEAATALSQTSIFDSALSKIQKAFSDDGKEHVIAFGRDGHNNIVTSPVNAGKATNSSVPGITNAFADLHNHPGNHPPDAGDLYGLLYFNKKDSNYNTRFVITLNKTVYALVVTNSTLATTFPVKYPRQSPACSGCSPTFSEALVDEFRELKYYYGVTDEMALALLLEKYNSGVSLLKRDTDGTFHKLRTSVFRLGDQLSFTTINCP